MSTTITWTCEVCSKPVEDEQGYITISYAEINAEQARLRAKDEARYADKARGDIIGANPPIDFAEMLANPGPHWRVLHHDCDPGPMDAEYWLAVSSLRTHTKLLRTTAHLMSKGWILDTDWSRVIYNALKD